MEKNLMVVRGFKKNIRAKLKIKGEFLNGKNNGHIKEYNWHENLIFEGEYLNGEKNGKGKK